MAEKELPKLEDILFSIKPCKGVDSAVSVVLQNNFDINDVIEILMTGIQNAYENDQRFSNIQIDRRYSSDEPYYYINYKTSDQWNIVITDVAKYDEKKNKPRDKEKKQESKNNEKKRYWIQFNIAGNDDRSKTHSQVFLNQYGKPHKKQ